MENHLPTVPALRPGTWDVRTLVDYPYPGNVLAPAVKSSSSTGVAIEPQQIPLLSPSFPQPMIQGPFYGMRSNHPQMLSQRPSMMSVRQGQPQWRYSLVRTELGPSMLMVPKEETTTNVQNDTAVVSSGQMHPRPRFVPTPPAPSAPAYYRSDGLVFNNTASYCHRPVPRERKLLDRITFPLNLPPVASGDSAESVECDGKIMAYISVDKGFLYDICTGSYRDDYVTCDLLLPTTCNSEKSEGKLLVGAEPKGLQRREQGFEAIGTPVTATPLSSETPALAPKRSSVTALQDSSRSHVAKLPCCTELAVEKTCISSVGVPPKTSVVDLDSQCQDIQFQQFCRSSFDEFDEIQDQMDAICFAKPEILSASSTLASLNFNKDPLLGDNILRRLEQSRSSGALALEETFSRLPANKKSRGNRKQRKSPPTLNTVRQSCISSAVSSALPLRTNFSNIPSIRETKHDIISSVTPLQNSSTSSSSFPSLFDSPPTFQYSYPQMLPMIQPSLIVNPSSSSTNPSPIQKPKPKPRKCESKSTLVSNVACSSSFQTTHPPLKPKRKSPFDWLDNCFSPTERSPEKRKTANPKKRRGQAQVSSTSRKVSSYAPLCSAK